MKHIIRISLLLLAMVFCREANSQDISGEANAFLSTLSPELLRQVKFPVDNNERMNWTIVPRDRKGVPLKALDKHQSEAATNLLRESLSQQGYTKTREIMALENVLRVIEGRGPNDTHRDPANYYFTIFGNPSKTEPWGWRLEGHHVSLNFFSIDGKIVSSTPSAFGSNPGIVTDGEQKGKQVLKLETDLGFRFVNSLSKAQLATARFSEEAPPEMLTLAKREADVLEPKGISYKDMTPAQQKDLLALLDVYVKNYSFGFSSRLMEKIRKAGIENLHFAWAGSLTPGAGHYYRIQGPMLLIEYDNTQTNANHVHTAVRDLTDDFAYDILREHYARDHSK